MTYNQSSANGKMFNNQFFVKKKISSGSFGVVYLGQDVRTKEYCAIKVEKSAVDDLMSLEREVQLLKYLQNTPQIPKLLWNGEEGGNNVMILQLLGKDLTHYLKIYKRFSLKCVLNIAEQLLTALENIHKKFLKQQQQINKNRSILHRDIKPENVLLGRDSEAQILYMVDFGISKLYKDSKGVHIPLKENKPFLGTTRYASISAHQGHELSRKDDLESLGYMLIYLMKGILPWQSQQSTNEEEKIKMVGQMKQKMDTNELCKDLPVEFARQSKVIHSKTRYMDFVKKLSFKTQPDYKYLQQLFKRLYLSSNFSQSEKKFDWCDTSASTKSSDLQFKKQNRRSSVEPSSLLVHQVQSNMGSVSKQGSRDQLGSGNLLLKNQLGNGNNDHEMNSNHSQLGPQQYKNLKQFTRSYLRLPDQRNSVIGSSMLSIDRNNSRHKSISSFNSFASSQGPENSVMVGFQQPSLIGSLIRQVSQLDDSQKNDQSELSVQNLFNKPKRQKQEKNSQVMSNFEFSPQTSFAQQRKLKQMPITKQSQFKQVQEFVKVDSKDSNYQGFIQDLQPQKDQIQETTQTFQLDKELNEDENMDLGEKYSKLNKNSVIKQQFSTILLKKETTKTLTYYINSNGSNCNLEPNLNSLDDLMYHN